MVPAAGTYSLSKGDVVTMSAQTNQTTATVIGNTNTSLSIAYLGPAL